MWNETEQRQMFGRTEAQLRAQIEATDTFKMEGAAKVAVSMLSDVQEQIEHGRTEQARQVLNCVKWLLLEYAVPPREPNPNPTLGPKAQRGDKRKRWLDKQIAEQRKWIEQCGGSLVGYVLHYGSRDDPCHYGDGGEAIYEADVGYLRKLEEERSKA